MSKQALILFAHGARDPQWAEPFHRLQVMIQGSRHDVQVELAFLELMSPTLGDAVKTILAQGRNEITIVPIFLGQGGHVQRDLPKLIEQLRLAHPEANFKKASAVGEIDSILDAMRAYCVGLLD